MLFNLLCLTFFFLLLLFYRLPPDITESQGLKNIFKRYLFTMYNKLILYEAWKNYE